MALFCWRGRVSIRRLLAHYGEFHAAHEREAAGRAPSARCMSGLSKLYNNHLATEARVVMWSGLAAGSVACGDVDTYLRKRRTAELGIQKQHRFLYMNHPCWVYMTAAGMRTHVRAIVPCGSYDGPGVCPKSGLKLCAKSKRGTCFFPTTRPRPPISSTRTPPPRAWRFARPKPTEKIQKEPPPSQWA